MAVNTSQERAYVLTYTGATEVVLIANSMASCRSKKKKKKKKKVLIAVRSLVCWPFVFVIARAQRQPQPQPQPQPLLQSLLQPQYRMTAGARINVRIWDSDDSLTVPECRVQHPPAYPACRTHNPATLLYCMVYPPSSSAVSGSTKSGSTYHSGTPGTNVSSWFRHTCTSE